jgi:preprotein translocase subunit Sss1
VAAGDLGKRLRGLFKDVAWILRRARKPDRESYVTIVKLSLLIVFILGAYSLIFSFLGYALTSRPSLLAAPYPENVIIIATVVILIVAALVYLLISTRSIGRGR